MIQQKWATLELIPKKQWIPENILHSSNGLSSIQIPVFAIVVHLHYEDYVSILDSALRSFPFPYSLFITTSNEQIAKLCEETFGNSTNRVTIRLTQNRGRNFGPLFVEFSEEMKNYEIVVHLHSKKSLHLPTDVGTLWSLELWQFLLVDPSVVTQALIEFMSDEKIGIYYPLYEGASHKYFNWARCRRIAKRWERKHKIIHRSGSIPFPLGGMFWFRPKALAPILESKFSYSDFPEEAGQTDKTLQHALERLVGTVPLELDFKHLVYYAKSDLFTTDISFVNKEIA